ncbi:MAG: 7-cyano-7-deazaguanine synthase QueC [Thermodesulfovibrionia bacterium]
MKNAVVLLSGGIDSTTTLAIASSEGYSLYALTFDYGQRHRIEIEMARRSAERFGVKRHIILGVDIRGIARSALIGDIDVPKDRDIAKHKDIPVTYVPARNVIFLSFALAFAETIGSEDIFIGANAIDYSGYPDCRPEFIKAFEDMANLAMKDAVEGRARFSIHAPLISMSKSEIIKRGFALGVDFRDTWSCYDPHGSNKSLPCGRCDSCLLRAKGFREAGIDDPQT